MLKCTLSRFRHPAVCWQVTQTVSDVATPGDLTLPLTSVSLRHKEEELWLLPSALTCSDLNSPGVYCWATHPLFRSVSTQTVRRWRSPDHWRSEVTDQWITPLTVICNSRFQFGAQRTREASVWGRFIWAEPFTIKEFLPCVVVCPQFVFSTLCVGPDLTGRFTCNSSTISQRPAAEFKARLVPAASVC